MRNRIIYGLLFLFLIPSSFVYANPLAVLYGPTVANEHLYRIALHVRPSGYLTLSQVMVAILKTNPNAFVKHNINGLKSGYKLFIPPAFDIARIDANDAQRTVNYQNGRWLSEEGFISTPKIKIHHPAVEAAKHYEKITEPATTKKKHTHDALKTKTTVAELVTEKPINKPVSTLTMQVPSQQTPVVNNENEEKLNHFISDTENYEQQINIQLAQLQQNNKILSTKVNQLRQELSALTYHLIQLTSKNQPSPNYLKLLFDNLSKQAVGLTSGLLAVILITYSLIRTFRNSNTKVSAKEDMSLASKLDLARVYIDMDDRTSAQSILKEVIASGNAEQKKLANDLLKKLN